MVDESAYRRELAMVLSLAKVHEGWSLSFDILVIDQASQMRPEDALAQ
jgi:superfamily I DNA and/or RNA helicase